MTFPIASTTGRWLRWSLNMPESAKRFTVESLAADLAGLCLEQPGVLGVRVRVEKPGAVRFSGGVGVEIERMKKDIQ